MPKMPTFQRATGVVIYYKWVFSIVFQKTFWNTEEAFCYVSQMSSDQHTQGHDLLHKGQRKGSKLTIINQRPR